MKGIERMTKKQEFSAIVCTICGVGFIAVVLTAIFMNGFASPEPVMPTRAEYQIFLRKYDPDLVIDGEMGSKSNLAAELYEKDLMNTDMARYIEKCGGINGDEK